MPRVTVLLPVYNGAAFVRAAVDSILAQTYRDFELLVIDDGSSDATPEVLGAVADPRLRIIRNSSNFGLTRTLNLGLRAARGELVARQDADDLSAPARLERLVAAFDANPKAVLIGTQARFFDAHGRIFDAELWRKCTTPRAIEWQLLFENAFVHTSVMFRRSIVLDALGGYDETFRTNQDFELWSRIARSHEVRNVDEQLVDLRQRAGSVSSGYGSAALERVLDVLRRNRAHWLQRPAGDDEILDERLAQFSVRLKPQDTDLRPFLAAFHEMRARFTALHADARDDGEIRTHCATVLARVARVAAPDAPRGLWQTMTAAREFDRRVFRRAVVPTMLRCVAGPLIRAWQTQRARERSAT